MNIMIFQYIVIILLCYLTAELESKFIAPKIFQESDTVVNTGENLTLGCEGVEPITWTIVNYNKIHYDKASIIKSVKYSEDSKFPYVSILRIENVSYINTGFFYCHGIKASKDDTRRSSSIYVFVRDENRLCIAPPEELGVFVTQPGTELTIPCLPTSPDIRVVLFSHNGEEVSPHESNFDPRKGFKIRMFDEEQKVFCVFTRNNQKQNFTIFLDDNSLPYIESSLVYDPSGTNIANVGNELVLLCSIIIPYNSFYSFQWAFNGSVLEKDSRMTVIVNPLIPIANGRLLTSSLKINNVTKLDEAMYHCFTIINSGVGEFPATYITVTENAPTTIVPPKINYPGTEIILQEQENLTVVCEGSESVNWYIDDLINYDENVNVTIYQESKFLHKAIFTMTNASVYNVASFVCRPEHVGNDHPLRANKIFVYVQGKSSLTKYVGNYGNAKLVILNTISNIPCIPSAPDVNVSLIDANGHKVPSDIASFSPKLGFTFIGKIRGLHNYTCLFQRGNIYEKLFIPVLVLHDKEYDKTSHIEAPDKVSVGQDLQLNCSMIVYDTVIDNQRDLALIWTLPESLAEDEKLVIEKEESYALSNGKIMMKRLTIKNVDFTAEGDYECILCDRLLNQVNYISKYITVLGPINAELMLQIPKRKYIVIGENLVLNCSVKINHNEKFSLYWSFNEPVKNPMRINITNLKINEYVSGVIGSAFLIIYNVTLADSGIYKCIIRNHMNSSKYIEQKITIHEPESPNIVATNLNNTEWKLREGKSIHLLCSSTGIPVPTITWFKNDRLWIIDSNQTRIIIQDNNTRVKFLYTREEDAGKYTCHVSNIVGELEKYILLTVFTDPSNWTTTQIAFIVILLVLLVVLVPVLIIKIIEEEKRKKEFKVAGLNNFEEGAVDNINPNLSMDSQAELLPYDKSFEIPRDKLKLGKLLGSGFFGLVIEAEAVEIFPKELKKTVAVKMVKSGADYMHIKALLSELKIMIHLGKHLNVVNLLGACTRNISKRELLVVVEYCRFGNIQDFLLKQRNSFINQIDRRTDTINISIGEEILVHFAKQNNVDLQSQTCYYNVIKQGGNYENITSQTVANVQKQRRPSANKDNEVRPICTHDLLCWSFQIAQGMEYLASRKVLHGDLAARNILLADDNIVKICDFGLAKNMYKNNHYKKKTDGPLPVKWMAPESITDRVFSTQSDVWSFGIVLWELFSLARTPYPDMEANQEFYDKLLSGYRMPPPEYATNAIYQIMLSCWQAVPSDRPLFNILSENIGAMLTDHVRKYYSNLNRPYANFNITQFQMQTDFLEMMRQPDYNNCISSSNTYVNITSATNENKEIVRYSTLDLKSNTSEEDNSVTDISENIFNCSGSIHQEKN